MESTRSAGRAPDVRTPDDRTATVTARPAEAVGDSEPSARDLPPRAEPAGRRPRDMAVSMLVLLIPIALLLGVYRVLFDGDEPVRYDPAPAVEQARAARAFPVSEPVGLADDWRTISAKFTRVAGGPSAGSPAALPGASPTASGGSAILRIGYVSPDQAGVQLVQSNVPVGELLTTELTDAAQQVGTVTLGGRQWQRYTAR
ncbi:MAG TPA: DUF4245 domain-containing protein, partial [Micromonospora sp.]